MKTRIHLSDIENIVLESVNLGAIHNSQPRQLDERVFDLNGHCNVWSFKEIFFENLHIGYGGVQLGQPTLMYFESDIEAVEMHFNLAGHSHTNINQNEVNVTFRPFQHNLTYNRHFKGDIQWSDPVGCQIFEVSFTPSFLAQYMLDDHQLFRSFKRRISNQESCILSTENYPITPEMYGVIQRIINCNRTGQFKKMLIESHVIELLMLQLEQISESPHCPVTITKQNQEKIYAVKELLEKGLDQPFTLSTLAREVGTNDFTLKKGFKELFGVTVFGYWNQLKMTEAHKLLMEGTFTVSEIGTRVGFSNSQSFGTAFKRHFGYTPGKIKRGGARA
ncbi:MAG: AraC family transcriptional regulator [Bacteroidota bacterium]